VLSGVLESIPWESAPKQEKERFNNARASALRWTVAESIVKLVEALK
jgi:hypothetical protein